MQPHPFKYSTAVYCPARCPLPYDANKHFAPYQLTPWYCVVYHISKPTAAHSPLSNYPALQLASSFATIPEKLTWRIQALEFAEM